MKSSYYTFAVLTAIASALICKSVVDSQLDFGKYVPKGVNRPWYKSVELITQESRSRFKNGHPRKFVMGNVPIIPADKPTPKWIPGELIASGITKRQVKLIDESQYGPLKSVTMFPTMRAAILVFNKRYHPERLADVLKYNFGVEGEPNGIILEETPSRSR